MPRLALQIIGGSPLTNGLLIQRDTDDHGPGWPERARCAGSGLDPDQWYPVASRRRAPRGGVRDRYRTSCPVRAQAWSCRCGAGTSASTVSGGPDRHRACLRCWASEPRGSWGRVARLVQRVWEVPQRKSGASWQQPHRPMTAPPGTGAQTPNWILARSLSCERYRRNCGAARPSRNCRLRGPGTGAIAVRPPDEPDGRRSRAAGGGTVLRGFRS